MLTAAAMGLVLLAYLAVCGLSVAWLIMGGEAKALKTATWLGKLLYWHGAFVLGTLMLAGALSIAVLFGRLVLGGS